MRTFALHLCVGVVVSNAFLMMVDGMFFVYVGYPLSSFPWHDISRTCLLVIISFIWLFLAVWIYCDW